MDIIEERKLIQERVLRRASEWAKSLEMKASAVLVGSFARGDFNLWSDVDILLISDQFSGGPVERLKNLDMPPGYQVIPLKPIEFQRLVRREDPLAKEALKNGVILRDDLKIFQHPSSTRCI